MTVAVVFTLLGALGGFGFAKQNLRTTPNINPNNQAHDMTAMNNARHNATHQGNAPHSQAYLHSMNALHDEMMAGVMDNDADRAFARAMIPHHVGAIEMAKIQLQYGKNEEMRQLAEQIIKAQDPEIKQMQDWLKK